METYLLDKCSDQDAPGSTSIPCWEPRRRPSIPFEIITIPSREKSATVQETGTVYMQESTSAFIRDLKTEEVFKLISEVNLDSLIIWLSNRIGQPWISETAKMISQKFSQFSEVSLITAFKLNEVNQYNIFISKTGFDQELIDKFIGIEIEVMDAFPGEYFDFHYPTYIPESQPMPQLSPNETVIFRKFNGTSSSFSYSVQA